MGRGREAQLADQALVREVERVYHAHLAGLRRVAAGVSGSREAAPDLVQEAFVRALRELDSFRGDGPVEGWLWRIVVNVALNHRRGHRPSLVPLSNDPSVAANDDWLPGPVSSAVRSLPERQRLVLFLRYYADLNYGAIAEALSISTGTVGATLTAARASLLEAITMKEAAP